jgi:FG-GAP-like repeat
MSLLKLKALSAENWGRQIEVDRDGTFKPAGNYPVSEAAAVAVGDFNSDGHLDLAVVNYDFSGNGTVSIMLGKGDGTFGPPVSFAAGNSPVFAAVGDFNGAHRRQQLGPDGKVGVPRLPEPTTPRQGNGVSVAGRATAG